MKTGIYLTLFILGSVFYSCEKDDDSPSSALPASSQSKYSILTSHYWRGIYSDGMLVYDMNFDSIPDTLYSHSTPDSCEIDDRYYFKTNTYLVWDPYLVTCAESIDSMTWSLANNDTELIIGSDSYPIIAITSSQIQFRQVITNTSTPFLEIDTISLIYP
jgi:hypothetical protein